MSPEAIPWLLCGAVCIGPALIGIGSYFLMIQITNRIPTREVTTFIDVDGRKHFHTEWTWLTREERKFRNKPEEKE
jgi:hypothetical protein